MCQVCNDEKILTPLFGGINNLLYLCISSPLEISFVDPNITENKIIYDTINTIIERQPVFSKMKSLAVYNISILGQCLIHNPSIGSRPAPNQ